MCIPSCRSHSDAIRPTSSHPYRSNTLAPNTCSMSTRSCGRSIIDVEMIPFGRIASIPSSRAPRASMYQGMGVAEQQRRPDAVPLVTKRRDRLRAQLHGVQVDHRIEQRRAQPLLDGRRQVRVAPHRSHRLSDLPAGPAVGAPWRRLPTPTDLLGEVENKWHPG